MNESKFMYRILFLAAGLFVMSFGVALSVKAKVIVDCSMVALGAVSSLVLLGYIEGIREGTVLSAVLVGFAARILNARLRFRKVKP